MGTIDEEIEKAKQWCKKVDEQVKNGVIMSLIDRMRPYSHLQNLLFLKFNTLYENRNKHGKQ